MCECTAYSDKELTVNHEAWEQGRLGNGGGLGMARTKVLLITTLYAYEPLWVVPQVVSPVIPPLNLPHAKYAQTYTSRSLHACGVE